VLPYHVHDPGFNPQHQQKKKKRERERLREKKEERKSFSIQHSGCFWQEEFSE
jgi:hypothetical protein